MRHLIAAGCLVFAALPIAASEPSAPTTGPDRVVCRDMMRTGSRFTKRTCRTVAEWDKMTEENRKSAHELIDRAMINKANTD